MTLTGRSEVKSNYKNVLGITLCYSITIQRLYLDAIFMEIYEFLWKFNLWPTCLTLNRPKVKFDIKYVIPISTFLFSLNKLERSISYIKEDRTPICRIWDAVLLVASAHRGQTATIVLDLVCLSSHPSICPSHIVWHRPYIKSYWINLLHFVQC